MGEWYSLYSDIHGSVYVIHRYNGGKNNGAKSYRIINGLILSYIVLWLAFLINRRLANNVHITKHRLSVIRYIHNKDGQKGYVLSC